LKSCKLNSFIEARQKLFWIGNVGNKANTHTSQHKEANMSKSDSSSSCLARSFKNSAWSMSSLMTALEESPSTICSHSRYSYTTNYSHHATEFSTPRDQVRIACLEHTMPLSSPLSACNVDNNNNSSTCLSDIDEWLEHSNKFCKSSIHLTGLLCHLMSTSW